MTEAQPALRWAVVGPGNIAGRFVQALQGLPDQELSLILGRDLARAQSFASAHHAAGRPEPRLQQAVGEAQLRAALSSPDIDAVYIATPHAQHGEAVAAALQAGKAVLCEKPLVPGLAQARPLLALAQARQVFLMEALWTRFLPVYAQVQQWLQAGLIGPLRGVQSSFCFSIPFDAQSRCFDPALAGGALLDIGIYNLSMTRWVLQQALGVCPEPLRMEAQAVLAPTGVDQRLAASLHFPGGISSQFVCAFDGMADNGLRIFGERGLIELPQQFWEATEARLTLAGQAPQTVHLPFQINGFEGEILEVSRCLRAGLTESPQMPLSETLATLAWMDALRAQVGVRYPFD